jgi:hypothetical protein
MISESAAQMIGSFERKILRIIFGPVNVNGIWRIWYNEELYRLYKDIDCVTYMHVKRLQWAGHVVRMFNIRLPKWVLEGSLKGRRPARKCRKTQEDEVWKDAAKLINTKNWHAAARLDVTG